MTDYSCMQESDRLTQSLAELIIDNTPNGILVLDKNFSIKEMNPSARRMTNLGMINPLGMYVRAVLPDDAVERLIKMTMSAHTEYIRVYYEEFHKVIDHAIVKLSDQEYTFVILMDRTKEDQKEKKMRSMRERTLEITDQVIEEQMRTVQEIASLLGETTAHSKVALTRLKEAMEDHHEH